MDTHTLPGFDELGSYEDAHDAQHQNNQSEEGSEQKEPETSVQVEYGVAHQVSVQADEMELEGCSVTIDAAFQSVPLAWHTLSSGEKAIGVGSEEDAQPCRLQDDGKLQINRIACAGTTGF